MKIQGDEYANYIIRLMKKLRINKTSYHTPINTYKTILPLPNKISKDKKRKEDLNSDACTFINSVLMRKAKLCTIYVMKGYYHHPNLLGFTWGRIFQTIEE